MLYVFSSPENQAKRAARKAVQEPEAKPSGAVGKPQRGRQSLTRGLAVHLDRVMRRGPTPVRIASTPSAPPIKPTFTPMTIPACRRSARP